MDNNIRLVRQHGGGYRIPKDEVNDLKVMCRFGDMSFGLCYCIVSEVDT